MRCDGGEVGVVGFTFVVVDGPRSQVVFGRPEGGARCATAPGRPCARRRVPVDHTVSTSYGLSRTACGVRSLFDLRAK